MTPMKNSKSPSDNPDATPGRPAIGGKRRQFQTNDFLERLYVAYFASLPEGTTESAALRQLMKWGFDKWILNVDLEGLPIAETD